MNFPSADAVYLELCALRSDATEPDGVEVRLQVYPDGKWAIRFGEPCYDTDHHGYWGAGTLSIDDPLNVVRDTATDMVREAEEQFAQE